MVTYFIDVNHISLGNVVDHHGCPEAVAKTVSHMFRKLRLLSNVRHSPVGYPLAFKPSSSITKKKMQQTFLFFGK